MKRMGGRGSRMKVMSSEQSKPGKVAEQVDLRDIINKSKEGRTDRIRYACIYYVYGFQKAKLAYSPGEEQATPPPPFEVCSA